MGNYKFRSAKLEVGVSGYMDILISNTYPARPLSFCDNGMGSTLMFRREHIILLENRAWKRDEKVSK